MKSSRQTTDDAPLPLWLCFALTTLPTNVLVYIAVAAFNPHFRSPKSLPASGVAFDFDALGYAFLYVGVLLFFAVPISTSTFLLMFIPWRRWYTAMLGGIGGAAFGTVVGGAAVLILALLSK